MKAFLRINYFITINKLPTIKSLMGRVQRFTTSAFLVIFTFLRPGALVMFSLVTYLKLRYTFMIALYVKIVNSFQKMSLDIIIALYIKVFF